MLMIDNMLLNSTNEERHYEKELFPPIMVLILLSLLGNIGNSCIVWVTFTNKNLQSCCNWLIAINAIFDIIHQSGHYIFAYYIFSGINYTSYLNCWRLQILPFVSFIIGMYIVNLIGIDRFICIVSPRLYSHLSKPIYICILIIIPAAYGIIWSILTYHEAKSLHNFKIICIISAFHSFRMREILKYVYYFLTISMVVIYTSMWIFVKKMKDRYIATKKVLKSLTIIMSITVCSWPAALITRSIVMSLIPRVDLLFLTILMGIFINFGVSINFIVYYLFSRDYRIAFQAQFGCLMPFRKQQNDFRLITLNNSRIKRLSNLTTLLPEHKYSSKNDIYL